MVDERARGGLNFGPESAWEIGDDYRVGERVIVARDPGVEPATAEVRAADYRRPHLVKVQYVNSRAGAWIARSRILSRSPGTESERVPPQRVGRPRLIADVLDSDSTG
jgi:hypothetical protein